MATIQLVDVAHAYVPGDWAVKDINLTWKNGISSALLGPSGCGKTTLLKIISGLLIPTQGQVLLDGQDVTMLSPQDRNIAQVFQFPVVYETLSVYDNLAFPLRNRGRDENYVRQRVEEVAEILDLTNVLRRNAHRLGAAEKQRISLGRGIVRESTTAVLFDEPLTVIDPHMKWHLRRKLKEIQKQLRLTMIYVTHDQHEALTFAEQVTVMNVGEAVQTGAPSELHHEPAAPFVGYFIGSPGMNVFDAKLEDNHVVAGDVRIPVPANALNQVTGKKLQVGIRPEFAQLHETDVPSSIFGEVTSIRMTGNALIAEVDSGGLTFNVRLPETSAIEKNQRVWATFPDENTMVYADERAVSFDRKVLSA